MENITYEQVEKALKEIWDTLPEDFGVSQLGENIFRINTGSVSIYTTKAGMEEFDKAMKKESDEIFYRG